MCVDIYGSLSTSSLDLILLTFILQKDLRFRKLAQKLRVFRPLERYGQDLTSKPKTSKPKTEIVSLSLCL